MKLFMIIGEVCDQKASESFPRGISIGSRNLPFGFQNIQKAYTITKIDLRCKRLPYE